MLWWVETQIRQMSERQHRVPNEAQTNLECSSPKVKSENEIKTPPRKWKTPPYTVKTQEVTEICCLLDGLMRKALWCSSEMFTQFCVLTKENRTSMGKGDIVFSFLGVIVNRYKNSGRKSRCGSRQWRSQLVGWVKLRQFVWWLFQWSGSL